MSDWCARLQVKAEQPPVDEDRPRDHPVRQVVAARGVGIGEQEHVLVLDAGPRSRAAWRAPRSRRRRYGSGCRRPGHHVPVALPTKQEKSWLWLKIGLRAVRVITQPICCEMWSSWFCTSASSTGSRRPSLMSPLRSRSGSCRRRSPSARRRRRRSASSSPPRSPRGRRCGGPGRSAAPSIDRGLGPARRAIDPDRAACPPARAARSPPPAGAGASGGTRPMPATRRFTVSIRAPSWT